MSGCLVRADSLRNFVERVFERIGYPPQEATDAADVLMWASLRGVDTHGVRNLKPYYVDRTLEGQLKPNAQFRLDNETSHTACLDGDSGLGLACGCYAMRLAMEKCRSTGVGMVCVRNTHHLGPAGYFAHMAVAHGMLGLCATGHFFGSGNSIGVAPLGCAVAMFSTNPFSLAAPCGRHAPFVLDMSTSVATVNRIEMHAQEGRSIPVGWACDARGNPTTDPLAAKLLLPLGGNAELGGHKGVGLAMMVSILSGVLSGAWGAVQHSRPDAAQVGSVTDRYEQPTMGHFFAAIRIDAFQPLECFRAAMDAMIDALHAAPVTAPHGKVHYPGEIEAATAAYRAKHGIPLSAYVASELRALAQRLALDMPQS